MEEFLANSVGIAAKVIRLAIEHGLGVAQYPRAEPRWALVESNKVVKSELYSNHNNDKVQATIVAIMKALIALKGSEG
ncbi:MAG TPA: hypothetical protein VGD04_10295 [Methylophilus sp.]